MTGTEPSRTGEPAENRELLPTASEINPYGDLNGICAEKNFLGKTLEEAREMFASDDLYPWEDLFWMGSVAFCYRRIEVG